MTSPERRGVIHVLDTSEIAPTFMLDCYSGAKIRLSETAKIVLEERWARRTFAEIAIDLGESGLLRTNADALEQYWSELERKLDELERSGGGPVDPAFGFRRTIFSEETGERIARRVAWMYDSRVVIAALLVVCWAAASWFGLPDQARHPHVNAASAVAAYGLFFISLFVHEFGHAAACVAFGGRPGRIGVTIYLVLPALFSDVGAAWFLKRRERVIVDLGGAYFHIVIAAIYVLLGVRTGYSPFLFATLLILITLAFNMNPIFKFDGYWVVADALGVPNLSKQPLRVLRNVIARVRGRETPALPWPRMTVALLVLYASASMGVWTYFIYRLGRSLSEKMQVVFALGSNVVRHHEVPTAADAFTLALALFGIVMGGYLGLRLLRRGRGFLAAMRRA